ncbi:hypothetical protein E2C01_082746 [Portunus trituberculatus]|uniref:Uncharacterized protein n=1 Tax=Portunus trituberculatus TaxID=210409 RepID=A0A5B7J1M5_PORTR|nr:hypothetical protein [Portunus trituberculatus]
MSRQTPAMLPLCYCDDRLLASQESRRGEQEEEEMEQEEEKKGEEERRARNSCIGFGSRGTFLKLQKCQSGSRRKSSPYKGLS